MRNSIVIRKIALALSVVLVMTGLTSCSRSKRHFVSETTSYSKKMSERLVALFGKGNQQNPRVMRRRAQFARNNVIREEKPQTKVWLNNVTTTALPSAGSFVAPSGSLTSIFKSLYFDTDKYTVLGSENLDKIKVIALYLTKNPNVQIYVEGHADQRGTAAYNLSLGSRRANSVKQMLVEKGVSGNRILTVSYGKERPISLDVDAYSLKQNRRVQFKIYAK